MNKPIHAVEFNLFLTIVLKYKVIVCMHVPLKVLGWVSYSWNPAYSKIVHVKLYKFQTNLSGMFKEEYKVSNKYT